VRAHRARVFPGRAQSVQRWEESGLVRNLPELDVIELAPSSSAAPWLYVSAGASAEAMEDGYGIEFLLLAPEHEPLATKLVSMVANLHADPRYPMSLGQVLEIGHPWLPGASATHLLITLPTLFGPELEWLSDRDATIRFAWLLPITGSEANSVQFHGFGALQERLGAAQLDVAARVRPSAV
jgi:hypothetical protein